MIFIQSIQKNSEHPEERKGCYLEIKEAFSIPEQLKGFISIDPPTFPKEAKDRTDFGEEGIISFADFYSQKIKFSSAVIPSLVSKDTLSFQYKIFKTFVFKDIKVRKPTRSYF